MISLRAIESFNDMHNLRKTFFFNIYVLKIDYIYIYMVFLYQKLSKIGRLAKLRTI